MKKYHKKIYNVSTFKSKEIKETVEKRYNILIVLILIVALLLMGSLFIVQVLKHGFYLNRVDQLSQSIVLSTSTPRGRIYDRNGKVIVDNEAVKVIYYKKPQGVTQIEEIALAYKVASLLDLEYDLSEKNLKRFWVKINSDLANNKITKEEWKQYDERKLTLSDIEELKLERITKDELNKLSSLDRMAAYVYYLMNLGYSYDEKVIKKDNVTDKEFALIAENANVLNGFDVRLDWKRVYPYGNTFGAILGDVSSSEMGIPYELKDYYLNLGYNLNDRVGISYLELQYESVLKGSKTVYRVLKDGTYEVIDPGKRGNDIVLTIDIELQKEIEKILEEEVVKAKREVNTKYYDHSFAIISDPNTGEILAMAGKQVVYKNGKYEVYDYTPGIITTSVTAGSIVKGASHTVGYMTGALKMGERRSDECIKIASTPAKCSWTAIGTIDDVQALMYSSNVYQFKTAINVGKGVYRYNQPLEIDTEAFDIYRKTFNEYGLGVLTGIDLPNESLGYMGTSLQAGHLLDFSIGQYDTYTPIQLVQYINTIASGGMRLKPYLLKAIYSPTKDGLTDVLYMNEPTILNKVNINDEYMERIHKGFEAVMSEAGTGTPYVDIKYKAAGKTGTSESFLDSDGDGIVDKETISNTFGAYAPYDNPRVSFVVVSPDVYYKEGYSTTRSLVNRRISYRISQKYFEIYK